MKTKQTTVSCDHCGTRAECNNEQPPRGWISISFWRYGESGICLGAVNLSKDFCSSKCFVGFAQAIDTAGQTMDDHPP